MEKTGHICLVHIVTFLTLSDLARSFHEWHTKGPAQILRMPSAVQRVGIDVPVATSVLLNHVL